MSRTRLVSELLASKGLRRTPARETVLGVLAEGGRPQSHAELRRRIGPGVDRVTLYRTLETLHRVGLLHQIRGEDGVLRYGSHDPDSPVCPGNHPHFLCLGCGQMRCLVDQGLPRVRVPAGCEVKGKQLVVFGYCEACDPDRASGQRRTRRTRGGDRCV